MAKFIKVYDENGKYAINPEDCPINVDKGSIIVYDLDGNITICKSPSFELFVNTDDIIQLDLKIGKITKFYEQVLFINDPKYGIIHSPSFKSMSECFSQWNQEDPDFPCSYKVIDDLLSLDRQILINHLDEIIKYVHNSQDDPNDNYSKKELLQLAFQNCFGQFYGNITSVKLNDLTNEELVYFIIQCENYWFIDNNLSMHRLEKYGIFDNKYILSCGCHISDKCECKCDLEK